MVEIFRRKHIVWLKFLFGSFALPRGEEAEILEDFAAIHYRHLKWIAKEIIKEGADFDWDREPIRLRYKRAAHLYSDLASLLESDYPQGPLFDRIRGDEEYMAHTLARLADHPITAFDRHLRYKELDEQSLEALVRFLLEETYKEYELIVTYTYSQLHTDDAAISQVFEDLIYESMYHLKSFALLEAKLGLLAVPRPVMQEVYRFEDLRQFLLDGIEEEKAAKEECQKLAQAIRDEDLAKFFDFINRQESYHIQLMEEVIGRLEP